MSPRRSDPSISKKGGEAQESTPVRVTKLMLGAVLIGLVIYGVAEVKSFFGDRSRDARNAEKARIMRLEGKGLGKTDSELAAEADHIRQENIRRSELEATRREVLGE